MEIEKDNEILAAYIHCFKTAPKQCAFDNDTETNHIFVKGLQNDASPSLSKSILTPHTSPTPKYSIHPNSPYTPVSVAPSLVSTHIYLHSLTFSHKPDEAVSVWRLLKLVYYNLDYFALLQHLGRYFNINTKLVSYLVS